MRPSAALAVALCLPAASARASPITPGCLPREAERNDRDLHRRYLYETNGRQGLRGYGSPDSAGSIVLTGSDDVVVLWHGFMASPPEMRPLGEAIHRSLGATVYIPLLPGFGGGARVADTFGLEDWRASVRNAIERARACHSRLALVGYSIGGGLLADYLLTDGADGSSAIRALVLLSPYVETAPWMMPALGTSPRRGLLRLLRSGLRLRRVRLETVDGLAGGRYRDLHPLLADPKVYDQRFSLRAGINMLDLSARLAGLPEGARSDLPTLLAVSEADRTVSWRAAEAFAGERFTDLEMTIRYEKSAAVPHEIVVPGVNPRLFELEETVTRFLARHLDEGE